MIGYPVKWIEGMEMKLRNEKDMLRKTNSLPVGGDYHLMALTKGFWEQRIYFACSYILCWWCNIITSNTVKKHDSKNNCNK